MNKNQLTNRIHTLCEQTGASFNAILTLYFLESILRRIAASDKEKSFIFKGGFLLASSLGLAIRTTKDIDIQIQGISIEQTYLTNTIQSILNIDLNDQIRYEILGIEPIRQTDPYGAIRCKILCKFENIKQTVSIDVATGDPISPNAKRYPYKTLFSQEVLSILSVSVETILSEKFHTIIYRGLANSRSKDFYDIYIIMKLKLNQIIKEDLIAAFQNTFQYRNTILNFDNCTNLLADIKGNTLLRARWDAYAQQNTYAKDIKFDETIQACSKLLDLISND